MDELNGLLIKSDDYLKISNLIESANEDIRDLLQTELDRATLVKGHDFPTDVVSMHSTIVYQDLETNQVKTVTLVFPHEADISKNQISILAPIGAALIGLRVGQSIKWPLRLGLEKVIKVIKVTSKSLSDE